jgi:molybdenum cofactor guanylyltransferase
MIVSMKSNVTGCVLAGGQGTRLGGEDKGLITLNGKLLSQYSIERLSPQVATIIISANRNKLIYEKLGLPIIQDATTKSYGPLGGFHSALKEANTCYVAFVPCDAPFLPINLIAKLMEPFANKAVEITMAKVQDKNQPVFAVMRTSLEKSLATFLDSGGRKIRAWYDTRVCVAVNFEDENEFMNINSPSDLQKAEIWLGNLSLNNRKKLSKND